MTAARTQPALLIALTGFFLLSVGDAIVKTMADQWAATAVSSTRYFFASVGLAILLAVREGRAGFVIPHPGLQLARGAAMALGTLLIFLALMAMPLADATAIQFSSPIFTALLSPLVLGERTTRATWIATLIAFTGVLVVLQPNVAELGWAATLPLGSAFCTAWIMMINRMMVGAPIAVIQFLLSASALLLLLPATLLFHHIGGPLFRVEVPSLAVVAKCLAIAVISTFGHFLIFAAIMRATAQLVAPMTYVQLLVAASLGWVWFGDAPDLTTLGGALLIISGGLVIWRSERVVEVSQPPD